MKQTTKKINPIELVGFIKKFETEYPDLYLLTTIQQISEFLAQPQWKQYEERLINGHISKPVFDTFMVGNFAIYITRNLTKTINF